MDKNLGDYAAEVVEIVAKKGYPLAKALVCTLYKSKTDLLLYGIDKFTNERFKIRIKYFAHEEKELSEEKKKYFYEKINERNMSILVDLLEKARISTYDLHAKILAKLYSNLIQNDKLNYYEHALLANISSLSDLDFTYFYNLIKNKPNSPLITQDDCEYIAINKFIQIGILSRSGITHFGADNGKKVPIDFEINNFSKALFNMLKSTGFFEK
ncbi:hypothetical protein [Campylobacter majalis]|uniref:hypothetical protein n=1 Tax=Campylobacter majalis TaxID=2790656 RepID=UPI003D696D09